MYKFIIATILCCLICNNLKSNQSVNGGDNEGEFSFHTFKSELQSIESLKEFILRLQQHNSKIVFKSPEDEMINKISQIQKKIDTELGINNKYYEFTDDESKNIKVLMIASDSIFEDKLYNVSVAIYPDLSINSSNKLKNKLKNLFDSGNIINLENMK